MFGLISILIGEASDVWTGRGEESTIPMNMMTIRSDS